MTVAVSIVSVKIDNISKSIEEKFEAKSPFFVFKDKEDYDKYIKEMKR
jgi:hypothetical protein